MLFGFDISSISAIIGMVTLSSFRMVSVIDTTGRWSSTMTFSTILLALDKLGSALAAGSVFGALIDSPFSDEFGRREAIFMSCFWWLAGTAMQIAVTGFVPLSLVVS